MKQQREEKDKIIERRKGQNKREQKRKQQQREEKDKLVERREGQIVERGKERGGR